MGGSNFDLLVQEVLKQQNVMEELEKENRELRRQLADLRAGRGIFIEICGKSFTFGNGVAETVPASTTVVEAEPEALPTNEAEPAEVEIQPVEAPAAEPVTVAEAEQEPDIVATSASAIPATEQKPDVAAISAPSAEQESEAVTAAPAAEQKPDAVVAAAAAPAAQASGEQASGGSHFLEEIMLDEFATAATKPMAVWNGPVNANKKRPDIDEEQKALLRRELTGSFLLE